MANYIDNGTFESQTATASATTPTGWTPTSTPDVNTDGSWEWAGSYMPAGLNAASGSSYLTTFTNATKVEGLTTTLNTPIIAGETYNFTFSYYVNDSNGSTNQPGSTTIRLTIGTQIVDVPISSIGVTAPYWTTTTISFTATDNTSSFGFSTLNDTGALNSYTGVAWDNLGLDIAPDYTVEGTSGDDLIDAGYVGDVQGDRIDNNDDATASQNDLVYAYDGNDTVSSGDGSDTVYAGIGNDTVYGGAADDSLFGEAGDDLQYGGLGNDYVDGDAGNDTLFGDDGNDTLVGDDGNDSLYGGIGSDQIYASSGNNYVEGGAGADSIYMGTGNDTIYGGADADLIYGGDGDDVIGTYASDDSGNDTMHGDAGNDSIVGGAGDDTVYGGTGNDMLSGQTGDDTIYGGLGSDTVFITDDHQGDVIVGGEDAGNTDTDILDLGTFLTPAGVSVTLTGAEAGTYDYIGTDAAGSFSEIEQVFTTVGADTVTAVGSTGGINVATGDGADEVHGSDFADIIDLGTGADTVAAGAGDDTIALGADTDADVLILTNGSGSDTISQFAAPTPNGDGTYTGIDQLDVTGLLDGSGNPVNVWDVVVTDNGSGSAVLTFPNGETVTLLGVSPASLASPFALNAIGIPLSDGTISGTAGDDAINGAYTGDPDGDMVDANDAILPGDTGNDDLIAAGAGNDIVFAGAGNDETYGGDGNDIQWGGAGNDTLYGDAGNDQAFLGAGNDVAYGGDGSDLFHIGGNEGTDIVVGGETGETGFGDSLNLDYAAGVTVTATGNEEGTATLGTGTVTFSEIETIFTDDGDDLVNLAASSAGMTILSYAGNDTLIGGSGSDVMLGGSGNDTLTGGAGADTLQGDDGDDSFVLENGFGADTITGGETGELAADQLYAGAVTNNVTVIMNASNPEAGTISDGSGTTTFSEIEGITLGSGDDSFYGSSGDDNIGLGTGADTIDGGAGNDKISLGNGGPDGDADVVIFADGDGEDRVYDFDAPIPNGDGSFTGIDTLDVTGLTDATGNPVNVWDVAVSADGSGNAVLTFPNGESITLVGVDPSEVSDPFALNAIGIPLSDGSVSGTSGADVIDGSYLGDPDGDLVDNSDAILPGDTGNDDLIYGYGGADSISAGAGNDEVYGGTEADTISGGADNDTLHGETGSDTLFGGAGNDTMFGGDDTDRFVLETGFGTDSITGGEGGSDYDVLDATALGATTVTFTANEAGTAVDGANTATFDQIEIIQTGSGDDTVNASVTTWGVHVETGAGNDTLTGGAGDDTLYGGAGDDILVAGNNTGAGDQLFGGAGNDTLTDSYWNATLDGGDGADTINAGNGDATIFGGEGGVDYDTLSFAVANDPVTIALTGAESGTYADTDGDDGTFSGIENFILTTGADTFDGSLATTGNQTVSAGAGDDTLIGGGGNDDLFGGTGNDVIDGNAGADTISAGAGNDTITFAEGDSVQGDDGDDLFILEDLGEPTNSTITVMGGDTSETLGAGDTLQLGDLADLSTLNITSTTTNASGNTSYAGTITLDDGTILNFSEIENIICFTPGTRIATPHGLRAIETLRPGDMVVTRDHGLQPIRWIKSRTVPAIDRFAPVRIRPGVVPGLARDLLVSPQHRMLFNGYRAELLFGESEVLVSAKHLIDGKAVTSEVGGMVTYIHMLFDQHEVIYAEGAATESFHPGDIGLSAVTDQAREELFALFPELRSMPTAYGRTARRCLKKHEAGLIL